MLRKLYHQLPLPENFRQWIKKHIPANIQRQPHLRDFGVINDLYIWRLDCGLDTVAPIQNYFSALFPDRDTATTGQVWFYDKDGNQIGSHDFNLPHMGFYELRVSKHVSISSYGTMMWHVKMPDTVAKDQNITTNHIYFTDRGYICYEKDGFQPTFVHGVDRYAVFQKQDTDQYTPFYKEDINQIWIAEFPINPDMQKRIDIALVNRSQKTRKYTLSMFQNGGKAVWHQELLVSSRGIGVFVLGPTELKLLGKSEGYYSISGIPTPWGRPAIMRHFSCGAISVMHC